MAITSKRPSKDKEVKNLSDLDESKQNELHRLTFDYPKSLHKKFKQYAALQEKPMGEILTEQIKLLLKEMN